MNSSYKGFLSPLLWQIHCFKSHPCQCTDLSLENIKQPLEHLSMFTLRYGMLYQLLHQFRLLMISLGQLLWAGSNRKGSKYLRMFHFLSDFHTIWQCKVSSLLFRPQYKGDLQVLLLQSFPTGKKNEVNCIQLSLIHFNNWCEVEEHEENQIKKMFLCSVQFVLFFPPEIQSLKTGI